VAEDLGEDSQLEIMKQDSAISTSTNADAREEMFELQRSVLQELRRRKLSHAQVRALSRSLQQNIDRCTPA
jgi:hypothetical protein